MRIGNGCKVMEKSGSNGDPKQYLVQKFVEFDAKGDGAWLSMKLLPSRAEAEKFAASLGPEEKMRIVEVVCEATK